MVKLPIYLDCQATTPVDPRVLEAMLPWLTDHFGNPASATHVYGWTAAAGIKKARASLAAALNASPEEIMFTSGATEANNLAIKGVAEAYLSRGRHLITVQTEHNAVLDPCRYLEKLGFTVTYLGVGRDGLVDLADLEAAFRQDTLLVSVMAANNEIGVLQPLAEIGARCRDRGVLFHSDGAQAIGKIPLDVQRLGIDLLSLTAHKIYGPKGIGALYVRRRHPRVTLAPQIHGGGHERGLRSGTLAPHQIMGLATAVELGLAEMVGEGARLGRLRDRLWARLEAHLPVQRNGHAQQCLPGNLNISIPGVDGAALGLGLRPLVALSAGAACSSGRTTPSHVLKALGHSDALAQASLRFGLGRFTTAEQVEQAGTAVIATVQTLLGLPTSLGS
ncbi:MAG: aminotransferase class V-fold PLP-dependent enzyme [Cyanobacteria bacterium REEB459]|nr:aminotransferase class V-fold PLP-dependent enzyme [Cyanobacteria bacterium REEB459]